MGFIGSIVTAAIKVALTPVAIVKDVACVVVGANTNSVKRLLNSAANDVKEAINDIT